MWKNNEKKWIEYIRNNNDYNIEEVISSYSDSIKEYIVSDMKDKEVIKKDIDFLQKKQNENNYSNQKGGYSQLVKLVNGWIIEDIFRVLLKKYNCKINGTDIKREVGVIPTNEPDLSLVIENKEILIEITNINMIFNKAGVPPIKDNKFENIKWWQGRAKKYINLKKLADLKKEQSIYIINVWDNFEAIMIKKVVDSDKAIEPKRKWANYIHSAISLDDSYFVFKPKENTREEIEKQIHHFIEKLEKKY